MTDTPKLQDGAFDLEAEWQCEHCKRKVRFGDTALSWGLNIICGECHEKERELMNNQPTSGEPPSTPKRLEDSQEGRLWAQLKEFMGYSMTPRRPGRQCSQCMYVKRQEPVPGDVYFMCNITRVLPFPVEASAGCRYFLRRVGD
jgi:hypothetical protein